MILRWDFPTVLLCLLPAWAILLGIARFRTGRREAGPTVLHRLPSGVRGASGSARWPKLPWWNTLIRGISLSLLVAAWGGPELRSVHLTSPRATVLVDISESIPDSGRQEQLEFLENFSKSHPDTETEIVLFAEEPMVFGRKDGEERALPQIVSELREIAACPPKSQAEARRSASALPARRTVRKTGRRRRSNQPAAMPRRMGTRFDRAIALARDLALEKTCDLLVVLTDGKPTGGISSEVRRTLDAWKVPLWLVRTPARALPVPVMEELSVARWLPQGEPAEVAVRVRAKAGERLKLEVALDGIPQRETEAEAGPDGVCRTGWLLKPLAPGFHVVSARVASREEPQGFSFKSRVGERSAGLFVHGELAVCILENAPGEAAALAEALRARHIRVERMPWRGLSEGVLDRYEGVVLFGPPAAAEPFGLALLEAYARSGRCLIFVAGDRQESAHRFEMVSGVRWLPVAFEPPGDEDRSGQKPQQGREKVAPTDQPGEVARVSLLLVMDVSGSMAGRKIELAREAAIAAVETLSEEDRAGVVAFDTEAHWVAPVESAARRAVLIERISRLVSSGGGTNLFAALWEAEQALEREQSAVRHVIALTDGVTEPADFAGLVARMTRKRMTVSTVGIGEDFDSELLADLARAGQGRFYFSTTLEEIPQIFTAETRRVWDMAHPDAVRGPSVEEPASRSKIGTTESGLFHLEAARPQTFLDAFQVPELGPLGTVLRSRLHPKATLLVRTREGALPVLAFRPAGLGRVGVWNSTLGTRENSSPLENSADFPDFASALVASLCPRDPSLGLPWDVAVRVFPRHARRSPRGKGVRAEIEIRARQPEAQAAPTLTLLPALQVPPEVWSSSSKGPGKPLGSWDRLGKKKRLSPVAVAKGTWKAEFPVERLPALSRVRLSWISDTAESAGERRRHSVDIGLQAPFPLEWLAAATTPPGAPRGVPDLFSELSGLGTVRVNPSADSPLPEPPSEPRDVPLGSWLIAGALGLVPVEIALRRKWRKG